jgi:hypothetical protein
MRGRVVEFPGAVSRSGYRSAFANERSADRRLAAQFGGTRLGEGEAHWIGALALFNQIALPVPPVFWLLAKRFSFGGPRRSGLGQAAAGGNA